MSRSQSCSNCISGVRSPASLDLPDLAVFLRGNFFFLDKISGSDFARVLLDCEILSSVVAPTLIHGV